MRARRPLATRVVVAAIGAVGGVPGHATFFGQSADPPGDAASPDPGLDLTAVGRRVRQRARLA